MTLIEFEYEGKSLGFIPRDLVIAGWTGRDIAAVEHHIAELAALGIARPRTTPMFYRVGINLLTTAEHIEVTGHDSSGEVEFVLISTDRGLCVGIGSDHTDRIVERYGVTVSKQMCPKPIGKEIWPMGDVLGHWDQLILRSWVLRDGKKEVYQEGQVSSMLPPQDLMMRFLNYYSAIPVGIVMYCGTLPVLGEIRSGEEFEIELEDPMRKRSLRHAYRIRKLPYVD